MKKVKKVTQLKEIILEDGIKFPLNNNVKIILDKKNIIAKKEHCLIFQQGRFYGTVGDYCHYLYHNELFELEEKGMVKIN